MTIMEYSKKWNDLKTKLNKNIIKTVKFLKYNFMTPVQATCIPLFQQSKDVAAEAVTGSGKTVAFIIPLLELLLKREEKWGKHEIGGVIISPTRELAQQTTEVLNHFLQRLPFKQILFVGGTPVENDINNFLSLGANIIIATPGRFEDLLIHQKGLNLTASLKSLEMLVLDEADRLLDLGFQNSLDNILKLLPKQRRTGLFSATQTKEVENLVRAGLRNPVVVSVKEKVGQAVSTPVALTNFYTICSADEKIDALVGFICKERSQKFIVFMANCACVEWFYRVLSKILDKVFCLYGKMGKRRNKIVDQFKAGDNGILLCTDVMARGIDIPEVDWVIQLEPPSSAAAFVHRVGRTARCGKPGSSLLFLLPSEDAYVDFIKRNQKVDLLMIKRDWNLSDTISVAHSIQLQDRTCFDLANRAFVSFIQSYSKHECSLILQVKDLPFGLLAKGFGLLRLPKMPELKNGNITGFNKCNVDFNEIKYIDKLKEVARQKKLEIYNRTKQWPTTNTKKRTISTTPWELSKKRKLDKKEKRNARQEKKALNQFSKRRKKCKISEEDIASLAKDIALIKKMDKKKISQSQFEKEFAGLDE